MVKYHHCLGLIAVASWMFGLSGCGSSETTTIEIPVRGPAAWDLNDDGECDLDSEDANNDGQCDGRDLMGGAGLACWDQNGNGLCDVDVEDLDDDGLCSAADCQGRPVMTGEVTGSVVDSFGQPVEGATITAAPGGASATTEADGSFTLTTNFGSYLLSVAAEGYEAVGDLAISVLAGETLALDSIVLEGGESPLTANAGPDHAHLGYGVSVTLAGEAEGSGADLSFSWRQTGGVAAGITNANTASPTVTMPSLEDVYAAYDWDLPDRTQLLGIGPRIQGAVTFELEVTDGEFTATDSVTLTAAENSVPSPAVPIGLNVFAVAAESDSYAWTLTTPDSSVSELRDADGRTPSFIPDVPGTYTLSLSGGRELEVYVGEWEGVVGRTGECTTCHNGDDAPDKFPGWAETRHASFFSRAIDGLVSGHYRSYCSACHTVGNSYLADNGGFDDVAADEGWSFPRTLEPGNWAEMRRSYPALARLANIQCENCHGPHNTAAHHTGERVSYNMGVCGVCHNSDREVGIPMQWESASHAELSVARRFGSADYLGPTAGDCGRCHSAQGFLAYARQLEGGDAGPLTGNVAQLRGMGLNDQDVEPVTCAVCHDSHSSRNDHLLRMQDSVEEVAGGFGVDGVGHGAVCVVCHNSAIGAHNDFLVPSGYESAEVSTQSDVLYARNAYFVTPGGVGADNHAAAADGCVTCHMREVEEEGNPLREGGHTFRVPEDNEQLCQNCHGEGVNGSGIRGIVQENIQALQTELLAHFLDDLADWVNAGSVVTVRAWDTSTRCFSSTGGSNIRLTEVPSRLSVENINRQFGLSADMPRDYDVSWQSARCSGSASTDIIFFQLESLKVDGQVAYRPDDVLLKAMWNLNLIQSDGTSGLHNPGWVMDVLGSTREVLWSR
jgi:hypothetical protein